MKNQTKAAVSGGAIVLLMLSALLGHFVGYRKGQIDVAQNRAVYLVIDGQVVHIEGPAPEPKIELKEIKK